MLAQLLSQNPLQNKCSVESTKLHDKYISDDKHAILCDYICVKKYVHKELYELLLQSYFCFHVIVLFVFHFLGPDSLAKGVFLAKIP